MYCKHTGCSASVNWRGTHCDNHATVTPAFTPRPRRAYDADDSQVRGIGVVTTRRIMVTRIKSVRRNGPVSYWTQFSEDMMRDSRGRISTKHIPTPTVQEVATRSLIATLPASNGMNPDA